MRKVNLSFTVKFTESKGHAVLLTKEAVKDGCRNIITIGGDGTLNEVVNGIFTADPALQQIFPLP